MDWNWKYLAYRSARLLLLSYGTVAVYAYGFSDRSILPSPPTSYDTLPDLKFLPMAQGQTIATRYLANPNAKYTLLMSHGNGEDLGDMQREMERFRDLGLNVLAYDYRGYGKSAGSASVSNVYGDIEAAYVYLTETLKVSPDRILLYGRSVGGGPSTYLAARKPVAGMILESTFISTFRVVIPIQVLPFEKFPNQSHLRQTNVPVLIIHGTDDRTIPFWHGEVLYESVVGPKQFLSVPGAGHNDVSEVAGEKYWGTIGLWLQGLR
jgi:abhydrolase domain-containing protein 17